MILLKILKNVKKVNTENTHVHKIFVFVCLFMAAVLFIFVRCIHCVVSRSTKSNVHQSKKKNTTCGVMHVSSPKLKFFKKL